PTAWAGSSARGWRDAKFLRSIPGCCDPVRHFVEANKPIASICRGPSLLLAAGVRGKRMTAIDVIRRDITMSGNTYVEAEGAAVVDGNIAAVSSRPYYHLWMQAFLSMLEERVTKTPPAADERAKALAMT